MSGGPDNADLLRLRDRAEWRAWLEANHASSPGVWLTIAKKGRPGVGYEEAVEEAVAYGWIDSRTTRLDHDAYKQLFTPRRPGGDWAPSNKRRVERLTAEGRMAPAGLAAVEAAKADGSWNALDDVEAVVVPRDLEEALAGDAKARANFEAFPDSAKKMILYWIATAKRPETRAKRIAETVRASAENRRVVP